MTVSEPEARPAMHPPWATLADALLHRAGLISRVAFDRLPSPLAGLRIDDQDLIRALSELPSVEVGNEATIEDVMRHTEVAIDEARLAVALDDRFLATLESASLSPTEGEILALLAAVELDPRRQRLVAYLNDDVTQRYLTPFSLAQVLMADEVGALVRPGTRLLQGCLVDVAGDQPWSRRQLRPAPIAYWRLLGYVDDDPDLPPGVEWRVTDQCGHADPIRDELLVVSGSDSARRRQAVAAACGASTVLVSPLPTTDEEWNALIRQASLDSVPVLLELESELRPSERRRIERATHLLWALGSAADLEVSTLPRVAWRALQPESPFASRQEIEDALGAAAVTAIDGLTADQLEQAAIVAHAVGGDPRAAVRRLAAGHIDRLATRTASQRGWDDLVLRDGRSNQVREVVVRYQRRRQVFEDWGFVTSGSSGVLALFSGESGTGKTLAAEIVANELGQDLYTVDLSQVTSKYIGETEKNLEAIFSAAESAPIVLFFDEADAMLGKRSEVSHANDRYANLEVAYLLQRIERYHGVVILATNLAGNIDRAFLRRIHVSVDFPMPDESERLRIWQRSLPPLMPTDGIDLEALATRFDMSGGFIRNASLTAAFLAADAGTPLTTDLLEEAVTRELRKAGRYVRDTGTASTSPGAPRITGTLPR